MIPLDKDAPDLIGSILFLPDGARALPPGDVPQPERPVHGGVRGRLHRGGEGEQRLRGAVVRKQSHPGQLITLTDRMCLLRFRDPAGTWH